MWGVDMPYQGQTHAQNRGVQLGGKPLRFQVIHGYNQPNRHLPGIRRRKDTHEPRFDLAPNGLRGRGQQLTFLYTQACSVIRHKLCAQCHQLKRQCRFACPRCACDQRPLPRKRNAGGMYRSGVIFCLSHRSDRQAHDKSRTQRVGRDISVGGPDIFGPYHTVMCFDDLFRNRQTQP